MGGTRNPGHSDSRPLRSADRLEDWLPPGESCSGGVIDMDEGVTRFKVGDRVACAGENFGSHAQIVSVPATLVAPVPDSVSFDDSAFATLRAVSPPRHPPSRR